MSHRIAQIESALRRAISQVLAQKLSDPRIAGLVSVTRVTVSPDLHEAFVYVSVLPARNQSRTIYGLRHAASHIYSKVCELVEMKRVPHLDFRADPTLKKEARVYRAIHRGRARSGTTQAPGGSTQADKIPGEASQT